MLAPVRPATCFSAIQFDAYSARPVRIRSPDSNVNAQNAMSQARVAFSTTAISSRSAPISCAIAS